MRRNSGLKQSFRNAFWGLRYFLKSQKNSRYHFMATVLVLVMSWIFKVDRTSFLFLWAMILLVWVTEITNSAIEKMLDMTSPRYSRRAKKVKDMAAAAVLFAALGAVMTGIVIFGPPLYEHVLSYR